MLMKHKVLMTPMVSAFVKVKSAKEKSITLAPLLFQCVIVCYEFIDSRNSSLSRVCAMRL